MPFQKGNTIGLGKRAWNKGKPLSAEHCAAISAALLGRKKSPEHAEVIRRNAKAFGATHRGERASAWKGDAVTYKTAHRRILAAKGVASAYRCVGVACGRAARDWSYSHADAKERSDALGENKGKPYSLDLAHYAPRCQRCHNQHDAAIRRQRRAA